MRSQLRLRVLLPVAVLAVLGLGVGAFAFSGTPPDQPIPGPKAAAPKDGKPAKKERKRDHVRETAGGKVTLASWARSANAICTDLNDDVAKVTSSASVEQASANLAQTVALANGSLARLDSLAHPRSHAAEIDEMLGLYHRFLDLEQRAVDALEAGDMAGYIELNAKAFAANDHGNRIAKRLGARACAAGGSSNGVLRRQLDDHNVVVVAVVAPDSNVDSLAVAEARAGAERANAGFFAVNVFHTRQIAALALDYQLREAPAILVFSKGPKLANEFTSYVDRQLVAQVATDAAA